MLKLLHYDLMFHFAAHVVTFLVKVTLTFAGRNENRIKNFGIFTNADL